MRSLCQLIRKLSHERQRWWKCQFLCVFYMAVCSLHPGIVYSLYFSFVYCCLLVCLTILCQLMYLLSHSICTCMNVWNVNHDTVWLDAVKAFNVNESWLGSFSLCEISDRVTQYTYRTDQDIGTCCRRRLHCQFSCSLSDNLVNCWEGMLGV